MSRLRQCLAFTITLWFVPGPLFAEPDKGKGAAGDPLPPAARTRLGSSRLWHGPGVTGLAFTPDGKSVLSVGDDPVIRMWDAATGSEVRAFRGHEGNVLSAALRPDGRLLASAGDDRTIRLWDVTSGRELHRWQRAEPCVCVRFSPNGKALLLAISGEKPAAVLWELGEDKETRRFVFPVSEQRNVMMMRGFRGLRGEMVADKKESVVMFAPDGQHFLYSSAEQVFWCDAETGKKVRQYQVPEPTFCHARLAPDGRSLAAGTHAGNVYRWETGSVEELPPQKDGNEGVAEMAFAPDGKRLAVAGQGGSLRVFDLTGDKAACVLKPDGTAARALAFSPDGKTLAVGEMTGAIRLWDVAAGKETVLPGQRPAFESVGFAEKGDTVVSAEPGLVRLWDARTGKETRQVPLPESAAEQSALSPNGDVLALSKAEGGLSLLQTATGKELGSVPSAGPVAGPVFSPDGKSLASAWPEDAGAVRLVATASGKELRRFQVIEPNSPATFAPDGTVVGAMSVPLAFTPDGALLICPGPGRRFSLYETATGKLRRRVRVALSGFNWGLVAGRAFSVTPDGRLLAAAHGESVALLDLVTGKVVRRMDGHEEDVTCLAVSPDGKLLASGASDLTVRIWDVATCAEKARLTGHRAAVHQVAFSPDGRALLSASEDRTALVWDVAEALRQGVPESSASRREPAAGRLWLALADEDAGRADVATRVLADAPHLAVPLLAGQLRPVAPLPPTRLAGLVAALDDSAFAEREKAARELARVGDRAVPPLRQALDRAGTSAEVRRRAAALVEEIEECPPPAERVRESRALEVLERIGNPAACRVLESLAGGDPEAWLTQRARDSLARLARLRGDVRGDVTAGGPPSREP